MSRILGSVVAGAAVVAFSVMPTANADKTSFMDYLAAHGYRAQYTTGNIIYPSNTILYGYMVCSNLHAGWTVEQQAPRYWNMPDFPLIAEAAQHELCPDTLGPQPAEPPPGEAPPP